MTQRMKAGDSLQGPTSRMTMAWVHAARACEITLRQLHMPFPVTLTKVRSEPRGRQQPNASICDYYPIYAFLGIFLQSLLAIREGIESPSAIGQCQIKLVCITVNNRTYVIAKESHFNRAMGTLCASDIKLDT